MLSLHDLMEMTQALLSEFENRWRTAQEQAAKALADIEKQRAKAQEQLVAARAKLEKLRTYGVMGVVRGPFTKIGNTPDNTVYSWPYLFVAELFCFAITVLGVLVMALLFDAVRRQDEMSRDSMLEEGAETTYEARPGEDDSVQTLADDSADEEEDP